MGDVPLPEVERARYGHADDYAFGELRLYSAAAGDIAPCEPTGLGRWRVLSIIACARQEHGSDTLGRDVLGAHIGKLLSYGVVAT